MEGQETQLLEKFNRDREWFFDNREVLKQRNLIGKFVAVSGCNIVASNKEMGEVVSILENKGLEPSMTFIEFAHPEGSTILL